MFCNLFKWVVVGDVDVDIGANPSEENPNDEAVDPTSRRVVDIVDGFRLVVGHYR